MVHPRTSYQIPQLSDADLMQARFRLLDVCHEHQRARREEEPHYCADRHRRDEYLLRAIRDEVDWRGIVGAAVIEHVPQAPAKPARKASPLSDFWGALGLLRKTGGAA